MTEFLLFVVVIVLIIIAFQLSKLQREVREGFTQFRAELKGYLLDIYAEMIKKD